jgi:hypothetical protein
VGLKQSSRNLNDSGAPGSLSRRVDDLRVPFGHHRFESLHLGTRLAQSEASAPIL